MQILISEKSKRQKSTIYLEAEKLIIDIFLYFKIMIARSRQNSLSLSEPFARLKIKNLKFMFFISTFPY